MMSDNSGGSIPSNPVIPKITKAKPSSKIVGNFIKQRRASLKISQRALGQMFTPAVTTQFISNVERGVTPLPPVHVPTLAKALQMPEAELLKLLEQEYVSKLSNRLGAPQAETSQLGTPHLRALQVNPDDLQNFQKLYEAYQGADEKSRQAFWTVCESILNLKR